MKIKKKNAPDTPVFENGLVELIRMEKSTWQIWVKTDVALHVITKLNSAFLSVG